MTATLHTLPTQKPVDDIKERTFARISAVVRVAQELHDERDPDCPTWFRKLEAFEGTFLAEVDRIQRHYRQSRAMGHRDLGDGEAYDALCFLNYRTEADDLERALAEYKAEREAHYNADLDAVAAAIEAAE